MHGGHPTSHMKHCVSLSEALVYMPCNPRYVADIMVEMNLHCDITQDATLLSEKKRYLGSCSIIKAKTQHILHQLVPKGEPPRRIAETCAMCHGKDSFSKLGLHLIYHRSCISTS